MEELKKFLTGAKSLVKNTYKNIEGMTEDEWIVVGGCALSSALLSYVLGSATDIVLGAVIGLLITGKVSK